MTKTKDFVVEFYTGQVGADGKAGQVSDLLHQLSKEGAPVCEISGQSYEIRDLQASNNGAVFQGIFAKIRKDDLPHAGAGGGKERELHLHYDEGLLEKNYFLYFRKNELLVYQRNGHGSPTTRFERYLGELTTDNVLFNAVLQAEPMRRLLRGKVLPQSLDLKIARPTNPQFFPQDSWNRGLLELLKSSGGMSVRIDLRANLKTRTNERFLNVDLKQSVKELFHFADVRKARLVVEEDGVQHPIDLIADRLVSKQKVEMNGRYPAPGSIYVALKKGRDEVKEQLKEIFGEADKALT